MTAAGTVKFRRLYAWEKEEREENTSYLPRRRTSSLEQKVATSSA